jgi:hypothetical protein
MTGILGGDLPQGEALVCLALFVALACFIPAAVVLSSVVAHRHVALIMQRAKAWLIIHERPILLVFFGAVGTIYTTKGTVVLV